MFGLIEAEGRHGQDPAVLPEQRTAVEFLIERGRRVNEHRPFLTSGDEICANHFRGRDATRAVGSG